MDKKLYKFIVPVSWLVCDNIEIIAPDLDTAIGIARTHELPENAEYIEGSFTISYDIVDEVNSQTIKQIELDKKSYKQDINNIIKVDIFENIVDDSFSERNYL